MLAAVVEGDEMGTGLEATESRDLASSRATLRSPDMEG